MLKIMIPVRNHFTGEVEFGEVEAGLGRRVSYDGLALTEEELEAAASLIYCMRSGLKFSFLHKGSSSHVPLEEGRFIVDDYVGRDAREALDSYIEDKEGL